jgi:hypothetical protein
MCLLVNFPVAFVCDTNQERNDSIVVEEEADDDEFGVEGRRWGGLSDATV